jgi:hypothetical protein
MDSGFAAVPPARKILTAGAGNSGVLPSEEMLSGPDALCIPSLNKALSIEPPRLNELSFAIL